MTLCYPAPVSPSVYHVVDETVSSFANLGLFLASQCTCFTCLYMYSNQILTDLLLRPSLAT